MNTKFVFLLLLLCLPSLPLCAAGLIPFTRTFTRIFHLRDAFRVGKKICKLWKISQNQQTCTSFGNDNTNPSDSKVDISLGTYPLNFKVGLFKQQSVDLIPDISLNLTFMLCQSSEAATNDHVYHKTKTFSTISPCSSNENCPYNFNYTSAYATSAGYMSSDIFYFNNGASYRINFGCGYENTGNYGNSIGYIGLGLNSSFLNQLNVSKFSYCLNSNPSGISPFIFDSNIQLTSASGSSTKFLSGQSNPLSNNDTVSYYITLTGITVGATPITILSTGSPPKPDGTGVMVLSSTFPITYLETKAYNETKTAFITQMGLQQVDPQFGLDLCFSNPQAQEVPNIPLTLHFDGADMSVSSYFLPNTENTVYCLMMLPQDDGTSILGNFMQRDMHMIYDIGNNELQFERNDNCSSLYT